MRNLKWKSPYIASRGCINPWKAGYEQIFMITHFALVDGGKNESISATPACSRILILIDRDGLQQVLCHGHRFYPFAHALAPTVPQ